MEQQIAFDRAKELLQSADLIVHFDLENKLFLETHVYDNGVGAVSSYKMKNRTERRIGYVSRIPLETERKCFTLKKEALFGVKKSHQFLYGQSFTIKMHRKPLERSLKGKEGISSLAVPRNQRWARWALCQHTSKRYRSDQWFEYEAGRTAPG